MMKDDWLILASPIAIQYANKHYEFTGEELSAHLIKQVGEPPNDAMFGYLLKTVLADQSLVIPIGMTPAKKKSSHGRKIIKWRSLLCASDKSLMPARQILLGIRIRFNTRHINIDQALLEAYRAGANSLEVD